ncbi:MAG TPA: hypothetical protein VGJ90_10810 [Methylophilaceae bacterium]
MLVQKKVPKEKDTLYRLFPALLIPVGGNRTRPSGLHTPQATAALKQAIAEISHFHCATRRDRRGEASGAPLGCFALPLRLARWLAVGLPPTMAA